MAQQVSFITETVFSHPSKLGLLRQAQLIGYTVSLHVVMVPEDKIRGRYGRLWELIARARHMADRADFYDNSSLDEPFRRVATYEYGQPVGQRNWPGWAPGPLT